MPRLVMQITLHEARSLCGGGKRPGSFGRRWLEGVGNPVAGETCIRQPCALPARALDPPSTGFAYNRHPARSLHQRLTSPGRAIQISS